MSWNYSGDPGTSYIDYLRFEITDTDPESQLMTDEEMRFCLEQEAPQALTTTAPTQAEMLSAAARGLEVLSRKFAMQANTTVGSLSTTYDKSAKALNERAKELRNRAAGSHAPFAGGQSESKKEQQLENQEVPPPAFTRKQFTNPYTGPNLQGGPASPVSTNEGAR